MEPPTGKLSAKRSGSESPRREKSFATSKIQHSASETDLDRRRGDKLSSEKGEESFGKVKLRSRISSGSKIQSIV